MVINQLVFLNGGMAERLNAPVLKTGMGASPSRVRIPVPPPFIFLLPNTDIEN
jgi:hypothetical protein